MADQTGPSYDQNADPSVNVNDMPPWMGGSGLGALRQGAYNADPLQAAMSMLLQDPNNPAAKWNAYAGAALKPATGGFGESMGNSLDALAAGQQRESELRARYIPLVSQALMQRQLQAAQMAVQQQGLTEKFDTAGTTALTGLLSMKDANGNPAQITGADVGNTLFSAYQRGLLPFDNAMKIYSSLPTTDPTALRDALNRLSIGKLDQAGALKAVTATPEVQDLGGQKPGVNTNPNAPLAPGKTMFEQTKTLTPEAVLGASEIKTDQAGAPALYNRLTNRWEYPNTGQVPGPIPPMSQPRPPPGVAPIPVNAGPGGPPPGAAPPMNQPPPGVAPIPIKPGPAAPPDGGAAPAGAPAQPAGAPPQPVAPPTPATPPIMNLQGKTVQEGVGKEAVTYLTGLSSSLDAMRNTQQRLADMRDLINKTNAGAWNPGALSQLRLEAASYLKDFANSMGLSPEQATEISSKIGNGQIENAQAFQKLATQGVLDVLKGATPRFTQAEFGVITKNSPSLVNDPAAFDKMQNFMTKQYLYKSSELQSFTPYLQSGKDFTAWPTTWDKQSRDQGWIKPTFASNLAPGSPGKATLTPVTIANDGRRIKASKTSATGWEYDNGQ